MGIGGWRSKRPVPQANSSVLRDPCVLPGTRLPLPAPSVRAITDFCLLGSDTICDLGGVNELANYGEYSGAPSEQQTYDYAKTILSLMTREKHPDGEIRAHTHTCPPFPRTAQQAAMGQLRLRSHQGCVWSFAT